jgi:hypothetical protein
MSQRFAFFLGGQDLEMLTIRQLLIEKYDRARIFDKSLAWGAKLSDYQSDLTSASMSGLTPVSIELPNDMPADWPLRSRLIEVDHHGARHNEASALRQVFDLLKLPESDWTRDFALVAANDVGHVRKMREINASRFEMLSIRRRDRAAQGISVQEEEQGLTALRTAKTNGNLLIVQLAHGRSATVTDPLALEPTFSGYPKNVVILSPDSTMFFGPRTIVDALCKAFPKGYSGGQGDEGFFGVSNEGQKTSHAVLKLLC